MSMATDRQAKRRNSVWIEVPGRTILECEEFSESGESRMVSGFERRLSQESPDSSLFTSNKGPNGGTFQSDPATRTSTRLNDRISVNDRMMKMGRRWMKNGEENS